MWGALIFLLFFLVIDPSTRDVIVDMLEQARLRVAVEAPLSYFLVIVLSGSALVSALIMRFWPRSDENRPPVRVLRQYQGHAETDFVRAPRPPAFGLTLAWELACLILPVRLQLSCARLLGGSGAVGRLKRIPGA